MPDFASWHHRLRGKPASSNDHCSAKTMESQANSDILVQVELEIAPAVSGDMNTEYATAEAEEDAVSMQQWLKYEDLRRGKVVYKKYV